MFYKYKSVKVEYDGIKFASKLECNVYKRMIELGLNPQLQVAYLLQNKFRFDGRMIHDIKYIADFVVEINGKEYIIETKGMETSDFKIKRKMFIYKYNRDFVMIKSVKGFNEWYESIC